MLFKIITAAAIGFIALSANPAQAGEFDHLPFTVQDEITRTECGDCHMVFGAGRLTVGGWTKIMDNLSDHFGEDASLGAKTVKHIKAYLHSKAMDRPERISKLPVKLTIKAWAKKGLVDPIRITETPNWTRHHNSAKYKNMSKAVGYTRGSNCIKCHKDGERGRYEEFPGQYE